MQRIIRTPQKLTRTFVLYLVLYVIVGLVAYYGVQYARDLRSRALITQELISEMRVLSRADMMNQDGVQRELPSAPESWLGTGRNARMSFLGLRFTGLALPTDAIIVSATMDVVSSQDQMAKINAVIFGERSAAPEEFSLSNPPARRQLTRTRIQLQGDNRWQRDVTYGFDVTDVVKELYTTIRPTDKIALIVAGRGDRNQKTYIFNSLAPDYSPTLTITYTLPEAYVTPTPIVDETILDVLMAPLRAKKPTPTQPPAPTPTSEPTPTPYQYVKPTPTPCPYPPDDPRCGASDQPTPITEPYVPLQSQVTPTPCPYPPDDPRCGY